MTYISLFSGIECASVAARPLGWDPICFSEIEPFPSAVLAHHYPDVPSVGDMTAHDWSRYRGKCDVVIGGSPCQAFSVAGRRESLADDRGNLTLSFVEAVNAIDPAFVVWENVPGVLSTDDNAFGCFLAVLAGDDDALTPGPKPRHGRSSAYWSWEKDAGMHRPKWPVAGYVDGPERSIAWRVLDAQYFGLAQRRERVFLVGCPRTSGFHPEEILFEFDGMRRDSPPCRRTPQDVAACAGQCAADGGGWGGIAGTVSSKWAKGTGGPAGDECQNLVAHTLRGDGFDASEDGTGRGTPLVAFHGSQDPDVSGDVTHPVGRNQGQETCVALHSAVRRLTPRECERLQGLPDDYTLLTSWNGWRYIEDGEDIDDLRERGFQLRQTKKTKRWRVNDPDGPRYKAIGNGMAVPCVAWVLRRVNDAARTAWKGKHDND